MPTQNLFIGECISCHTTFAKRDAAKHVRSCFRGEGASEGFLVTVESTYPAGYWLILVAGSTARLADIDGFLRTHWLECCGHASGFRRGTSSYDTFADMDEEDLFDDVDSESLKTPLEAALPPGSRADYVYDYGSSTELTVRVARTRPCASPGRKVKLLAFNRPPAHVCHACQAPAERVCTYCPHSEARYLCRAHVSTHACTQDGGEDVTSPMTNSPRVGICGYDGPPGRVAAWTRA